MSQQDWDDIEGYKQNFINGDAIAIIWQADDVLIQAEEDGIQCTNEQAREVLRRMKRKHDATIGISWETISHWIENVTGGGQ